MAKNGKVLSIDITNESITIIEITASDKKQTQVHNVIIFETPEDSYEDGVIKAPDRIAYAIKEQLGSRGITNKNVIFVLSSTKIVNREVTVPFMNSKKIRDYINSNSSEYFPVNIEDYAVSHAILETVADEGGSKQLRVLAIAAPASMVKSYHELASIAGLNIVDIDYIGNAMFELIKTQIIADTTTMVIQLGSEATVLNIVQGENLLLQRTVPYGTNSVVNVVMDERNVDATTAMTLLQNEKIITADFADNEATGAFRYLINNIGRVMDFYASKNPTRPIEDVCLTGDGALIKGIDGLFKVQLNVNTRIMDNLINIRFSPTIDLKVYNPVYLVTPIGAAFNPMGFVLGGSTRSTSSSSSSNLGLAVAGVLCIGMLAGAAGLAFSSIKGLERAQDEKTVLEQDIARLQPIKQVIADRDQSRAVRSDVIGMCASTYTLNENAREFLTNLEEKIPQDVVVTKLTSSSENGVDIQCYSYTYDAIADYIVQLKTVSCINDVYIDGWNRDKDDSGEEIYVFKLTAEYVANNPYLELTGSDVEEEAAEAGDAETTEATEEVTE